MNVLDTILEHLETGGDRPALIEIQGDRLVPTSATDLQDQVRRIRSWLKRVGVVAGDRVALLANNSATWAAADLAILSEGAICVPLYARQNVAELAGMLRDCTPNALIAENQALAESIQEAWNAPHPVTTFPEALAEPPCDAPPADIPGDATVTLIYTSGTSGEPKGVMITADNVDFMVPTTVRDLDHLMNVAQCGDHPFHYLPFCFAGSRIMLWTQLHRATPLMLSTDLTELAVEIGAADPAYSLNVPALLERIRWGVIDGVKRKGGIARALYNAGEGAFKRSLAGERKLLDGIRLSLATRIVFEAIRARIGKRLGFLVCGSAPLSEDTQQWFEMLSIPVYQVYGLTETTAIVTMDRPGEIAPGHVGSTLEGVETRVTDEGEFLLRGPNVFAGYWNRPDATAETLRQGWLHTGDQVTQDAAGRWKIIGRVKNLLVPESGHNIAPEPLEALVVEHCEGVEQVMLIGHGRPWLSAIVTGTTDEREIQQGLDLLNATLPHYRRVRKYVHTDTPFSDENRQLTANQKMRRTQIESDYQDEIEELYAA
jgi:long-chain acyl-CoA synthetase